MIHREESNHKMYSRENWLGMGRSRKEKEVEVKWSMQQSWQSTVHSCSLVKSALSNNRCKTLVYLLPIHCSRQYRFYFQQTKPLNNIYLLCVFSVKILIITFKFFYAKPICALLLGIQKNTMNERIVLALFL